MIISMQHSYFSQEKGMMIVVMDRIFPVKAMNQIIEQKNMEDGE